MKPVIIGFFVLTYILQEGKKETEGIGRERREGRSRGIEILHFYEVPQVVTFMRLIYSSLSLVAQRSPSLGPAFVRSKGIDARVFLVASSTISIFFSNYSLNYVRQCQTTQIYSVVLQGRGPRERYVLRCTSCMRCHWYLLGTCTSSAARTCTNGNVQVPSDAGCPYILIIPSDIYHGRGGEWCICRMWSHASRIHCP